MVLVDGSEPQLLYHNLTLMPMNEQPLMKLNMMLVDLKSTVEKARDGIDGAIAEILNSDLPDDVKVKRYSEVARRFTVINEPSSMSSESKS